MQKKVKRMPEKGEVIACDPAAYINTRARSGRIDLEARDQCWRMMAPERMREILMHSLSNHRLDGDQQRHILHVLKLLSND